MSQQQKNSLLTFLDVVRQQVSSRLHRPDWSGFNPTTNAPLFSITNKELWGFGGEKMDKHKKQRSVKRHRHDSWVSCNSDECFPCTDMKFQVHKLSKPLEGLFIAIFGLPNNGPEWSYSFHIFECIFDGSEWVSECDHCSVGENTPQTCHWPIWLHFHVASFGDSDCSSKDVVITTGSTKRHMFFEDWNFYLEVCIAKKKITHKGSKTCYSFHFQKRF